jgi:dipeptidyl aminopeptidase/acylaminoacyl peptidase
LYVISGAGRDKSALFAYDVGTGKVAPRPLVDLEEYDFSGTLVTNASKLLGVRYTVDSEAVAWFDQAMKAAQDTVDKLLPGRVNALSVGVRSETPFVLVESWSDRQPPVLLLFNRDTGKLSKVGDSRPAIAAARMGTQDLVRVKARDGRAIPTWLTMPAKANGKGRQLPTVVLVHGGPYVRGGEWGWDAERQFLASRGYLVLEPEYRGSTGYGAAHFRAGWKQWGLAMQDDIADATRWAIAEGMADPKRICIAGASYGGYAALMGLVRNPALYRCAIDWAGVTDIDLLYTGDWTRDSDTSDAYKRYGMPALVGDRVADAAQFAATSPLKQAARITQPLLLAYGGADRRVPLYHGRKFYDAVKQTNKNVEWVVYEDEGHGWTLVETRVDFWGRVEKFLGRHIGPGGD